jgi:thiamine-monophosphate kinase
MTTDGAQEPTVADLGEDPLVADVITRYPGAAWLTVGPGDDAAVLDLASRWPGKLVFCTDTLVEEQDFRRDWSSAVDVGVKVAAQNFADIAAMGGRPHALLISLTTPGDLPAAWAGDLAVGVAAECERAGAVVAGGDLSGGAQIVITGTALGTLAGPAAVLRCGAQVGDVVAVAGVLGRSAAGWALLRAGLAAGSDPVLAALITDHRRPRPPYPAGPQAAAAGATAMIDTSDGLVRDAIRLAAASGVRLDLDPLALTPEPDLLHAAAALPSSDAQDWILTGGEDHALLACFPPGITVPASFVPIGAVRAGAGVTLAGRPVQGAGGWRHFS